MAISIDEKKEWLENIRRVSSPNCDARPENIGIDTIVIHGISLPPQQYGGPYVEQLFTNCLETHIHPYFAEIAHLNVSSHLFVDRNGSITQFVPFNKRAWHAGESELNGRRACNDFSIGIELEGCDDEPYEQDQYETVAEIISVLMSQWPDITQERIVGHSDIAPDRKTDPGPAFDWDHLFSLIHKQHSKHTIS